MKAYLLFVGFIAVGLSRAVSGETEVVLTLKPLGEQHYKALGEAMVFTCEAEESDGEEDDNDDDVITEYKIHWFDPKGVEIAEKTGRKYVEEESNIKKLYVTEFESGDVGRYRCEMTHNGKKHERTFSLKLYEPITFVDANVNQFARIYTDALIKCVVSGDPKPEVSWRLNGQRLVTGGRYAKTTNGLRITNATLSDTNAYTCRAEVESDGRMEEKVIQMEIHIPPTLIDGPGDVTGVEGEAISMKCRANGKPAANYTFYKGAVPLVSSDRIQVDSVAGTVYFRPLSKEDENNIYNCTASNDVGSDWRTGSLKVQVKPSITELNNVTETESKVATLVCVSRGDPAPEMTFTRVDKPVTYTTGANDGGRITVRTSGLNKLELVISQLKPSDAGNYQCSAVSSLGSSQSQAQLTVLYKPIFSEKVRVERIWAGKTRDFVCRPSAEPEAVIEWRRNENPISNNGTYTVINANRQSILRVTVREQDQLWVYGTYKCAARNRLGNDEQTINLFRATVPDAPNRVRINSTTPTGVTINVEAPEEDGGMPILGYRVEYDQDSYDHDFASVSTEGGDPNEPRYNTARTGTADSNGDRVEIDNLKPSTTYLLRIKAKNEVGVGLGAFQLNVTTENIRKPYPIVISSPRSSDGALHYHVTWNKPNTGGLPIDEYEIRYRRVRIENGRQVPIDDKFKQIKTDNKPSEPRTRYHLDNLEPNTHYELQILAHNSIDWSEPSAQFTFVTAPAAQGVSRSAAAATALISTEFALRLIAAAALVATITRRQARQLALCC